MASLSRKLLNRVLGPISWAYYRWGYGRTSTALAWLGRRLGTWEESGGRGDVPVSGAQWDEEFSHGRWGFLGAEKARYAVLAALLEDLPGDTRLLDVGCGEAPLFDALRPAAQAAYAGIDLSSWAIESARQRLGGHARLAVADAESFELEPGWGGIVLNECLYYLHDPVAQAARYAAALAPGGVLVISMFRSVRTEAILRALERRLELAERLTLTSERGSWQIALHRAARA
ncbi:MAG: methyltransferase domain-containing protein [Thermoanaerobaculia bacterium]